MFPVCAGQAPFSRDAIFSGNSRQAGSATQALKTRQPRLARITSGALGALGSVRAPVPLEPLGPCQAVGTGQASQPRGTSLPRSTLGSRGTSRSSLAPLACRSGGSRDPPGAHGSPFPLEALLSLVAWGARNARGSFDAWLPWTPRKSRRTSRPRKARHSGRSGVPLSTLFSRNTVFARGSHQAVFSWNSGLSGLSAWTLEPLTSLGSGIS